MESFEKEGETWSHVHRLRADIGAVSLEKKMHNFEGAHFGSVAHATLFLTATFSSPGG